MGKPLHERSRGDTAELNDELDEIIGLVIELLPHTYDNTAATRMAATNLRELCEAPRNAVGLAARRALVLHAAATEPEVAERFGAEDLAQRIWPFMRPKFAQNSYQAPDALVIQFLIFSELFHGERLGSFPTEDVWRPLRGVNDAAGNRVDVDETTVGNLWEGMGSRR